MFETFDDYVARNNVMSEDLPTAFGKWMQIQFGWNGSFIEGEE